MHCTYIWYDTRMIPYYVGKGPERRAFRSGCPTQAYIFVQHWASEEEAFEMEKWWIDFYGCLDLGTGCLTNKNGGGRGFGSGPKRLLHRQRIGAAVSQSWKAATPERFQRLRDNASKGGRAAAAKAAAKRFAKGELNWDCSNNSGLRSPTNKPVTRPCTKV